MTRELISCLVHVMNFLGQTPIRLGFEKPVGVKVLATIQLLSIDIVNISRSGLKSFDEKVKMALICCQGTTKLAS